MTAASRLRALALDHAERYELDKRCGGDFFQRHPIGTIGLIRGGWQYGYEIEGYGTVLGYCLRHRPHNTREQAAKCGARYEAGQPARFVDAFRKATP